MKKMPDYGGTPQIIQLNDGGKLFSLNSHNGEINMTRYAVFPRIEIIYNDIHLEKWISEASDNNGNILEIDHCRDGRMEFHSGQEKFCLVAGDIAIHRLGSTVREETFPTGHFHGITIRIDLDNSPKCLSEFLEDVNVEPAAIGKKFLSDSKMYYAMRQLPAVEHIFSELYDLPQSVKNGYFKVKILELFLFLAGMDCIDSSSEQRGISEQQSLLAKNICSYLTEHIGQRITIAELSEQFGVSSARIRNSFSGVYGTTVYAYMRGVRMRKAAKLLCSTDRTVLDIAGELGYDNGSKFAVAFRAVMGVTPAQYRNNRYRKD